MISAMDKNKAERGMRVMGGSILNYRNCHNHML